jgi:hypothetical protein
MDLRLAELLWGNICSSAGRAQGLATAFGGPQLGLQCAEAYSRKEICTLLKLFEAHDA